MYITEYYTINKETKLAVRGVFMYREKRDFLEKRKGKILAIYVAYSMFLFPKKSHRKRIWEKLCWKESSRIKVRLLNYSLILNAAKLGKVDYSIFGLEVRALRRKLDYFQKKRFDSFYYEK